MTGSSSAPRRQIKLAAVASNGGHLIQLRRLRPLLDRYDTTYYVAGEGGGGADEAVQLQDFTRARFWLAARTVTQVAAAFARNRPDVVLTTGSAPGLIALAVGRVFGARTIWIDSIANAGRLSRSGGIAKMVAHRCLTQWPSVAQHEKVACIGNVL
jgi:hypothetical protein